MNIGVLASHNGTKLREKEMLLRRLFVEIKDLSVNTEGEVAVRMTFTNYRYMDNGPRRR